MSVDASKKVELEEKTGGEEEDDLYIPGGDGYSAERLFRNRKSCYAFTYDDIIIMPGHISSLGLFDFDISLESNVTRKVLLCIANFEILPLQSHTFIFRYV